MLHASVCLHRLGPGFFVWVFMGFSGIIKVAFDLTERCRPGWQDIKCACASWSCHLPAA